VYVAHEPKWSLVFGGVGAMLGFVARGFSTHFMLDDRKQRLDTINKTLDMKKLAHLAPNLADKDAAV